MEETSTFGIFAKYFISVLVMLWMMFAGTLLGGIVGVSINMLIDNDTFIPKIIYPFLGLGFLSGIAFGIYRLRDDFL